MSFLVHLLCHFYCICYVIFSAFVLLFLMHLGLVHLFWCLKQGRQQKQKQQRQQTLQQWQSGGTCSAAG